MRHDLDRKAAYEQLFVVMPVDEPGGAPDEDQHLCLLPSAESARELGDGMFEHFRVYALTEVTDKDRVVGEPATPAEALDLDAIEARASAATQPPWHGEHEVYEGRELLCVSIGNYGWVCSGEHAPEYDVDSEQGKADAEFIAHARTDVPALVAAVRQLRAELDAARSTVPGPAPTDDLLRGFTERVGLLREPDEDYSNEADARALLWWLLSQLGTSAPVACCSRLAGHKCDLHSAPTTYALPAEPPPEVTELWDKDGDRWEWSDGEDGGDSGWMPDTSDSVWEWPELVVEYGPLSSVPPGTETDQ